MIGVAANQFLEFLTTLLTTVLIDRHKSLTSYKVQFPDNAPRVSRRLRSRLFDLTSARKKSASRLTPGTQRAAYLVTHTPWGYSIIIPGITGRRQAVLGENGVEPKGFTVEGVPGRGTPIA
jgi:hypothetical protein